MLGCELINIPQFKPNWYNLVIPATKSSSKSPCSRCWPNNKKTFRTYRQLLNSPCQKRSKIDFRQQENLLPLPTNLSNLPTQQLWSLNQPPFLGPPPWTIGPEVRTPTYAIQGCIQLFIPLLQLCRCRQALPELDWLVGVFLLLGCSGGCYSPTERVIRKVIVQHPQVGCTALAAVNELRASSQLVKNCFFPIGFLVVGGQSTLNHQPKIAWQQDNWNKKCWILFERIRYGYAA